MRPIDHTSQLFNKPNLRFYKPFIAANEHGKCVNTLKTVLGRVLNEKKTAYLAEKAKIEEDP